ncbi:hypothetical protein [Mesorhizobium sp. KR9-304]|uniref:hypothetical protein n=1 Tax=Mesorhizobium sp. KR9-304 TaxID=3156614 RepID=UPI0032B42E48
MTEKAIEFLQEWIHEKVQAPETPASIDREAGVLAKQCAAQAANAGVRLEDIEEEVGDLEELIATKLEDAVEAMNGGAEESTRPKSDGKPDSTHPPRGL